MSKRPKGKCKVSGQRACTLAYTLKSKLLDIYSSAKHFKLTHEDIMDEIIEKIYPDRDRLPAYYRGHLDGYHEGLRDGLWNQMVWCLWVDNQLLTRQEVDDLARKEKRNGVCLLANYPSPISRVNANLSRHVWADSQGNALKDKSFDRRFRK